MKFDWIIVGAGFTGSVLAERLASQYDQKVLIIDRRDHIGGNAYDEYDEHGILIHRYGAHIFHTNSKRIWEYLSLFTDWNPYFHEVRGMIEGKLVPIPFNLNSMHALFPKSMAERLERRLVEKFNFGSKVPILRMLDDPDPEIKQLAAYAYKEVFENYTIKQWELSPRELDASVTGRVPVVVSRDNRYFQDSYQAIPRLGYTHLFRRMLSHPNIRIMLKTDYKDLIDDIGAARLIFTGAIDEYFNYTRGNLPYRSLRFEFEHQAGERKQPFSVINYPNDHLFTRTIEFKYFSRQSAPGTTIAYEFPQNHIPGLNDPYYPIPKAENREQHELYLKDARGLKNQVVFAGRLADYKYYNMDQAVGRALKVFDEISTPSAEYAASDVLK